MRRALFVTAVMVAGIPGVAWSAAVCTASATSVAFGTINPFGSPATSNGTITVACTGGGAGNTYTIALSTGGAGTYTMRKMTSGTNTLNYNLYTSSALSSIWGDGTGGSATITGRDEKATSNFTVYGKLPTPQGVTPSSYNDTVTVTVTY
jgi:spore coat protein U-like protein